MSRTGAFVGRVSRRGVQVVAIATTLVALVACTATYRRHGYVPSEAELAEIQVGRDTRDTVADFIGRPSSSGVLAEGGWYYVGSEWKFRGARAPEEIGREVVAISFAPDGRVANIERFGLDQGRVVALSRRVTDSNIKGVSFLRQLLGNIGNFQPGQTIE